MTFRVKLNDGGGDGYEENIPVEGDANTEQKIDGGPRVRLSKDAPDTVKHITAGCQMQAGEGYLERHNQVAVLVYRNSCTEYWLEVPAPPKLIKNDQAQILWVFQIKTDEMWLINRRRRQ